MSYQIFIINVLSNNSGVDQYILLVAIAISNMLLLSL